MNIIHKTAFVFIAAYLSFTIGLAYGKVDNGDAAKDRTIMMQNSIIEDLTKVVDGMIEHDSQDHHCDSPQLDGGECGDAWQKLLHNKYYMERYYNE